MKKVILTGSPGTGKSTLLMELSYHFSVVEEVSRNVIAEQQHLQTPVSPWGDVEKYAEISLRRMIRQYKKQQEECCIYDRAIPDVIAWLRYQGKSVKPCYQRSVREHLSGSLVFFAPAWEAIYTQDAQRPETYHQILPMSKLLRDTYQALEFDIIDLPKDTISSRASFVKLAIKSFLNR